MTESLLQPGSTAARRDIFRGRVWSAAPMRVLASDENSAVMALWPGVVTLAADNFVASGGGLDKALRTAALDDLASGEWRMEEWAWLWTGVVQEVVSERWFSVARRYDGDGALTSWYVNFEHPPTWHASGWDTMDLALDLVVDPDGAWRWKDEDEYEQCRRLGVITDAEHAALAPAREQAVALVESRAGMFAEDPAQLWLPDPAWPRPALRDL